MFDNELVTRYLENVVVEDSDYEVRFKGWTEDDSRTCEYCGSDGVES